MTIQPGQTYRLADPRETDDTRRLDAAPSEAPGTAFVPTADDMAEEIYGVLLDANEDYVFAIASDERRAIAALNAYQRRVVGEANMLNNRRATLADARKAISQQTVVFTRSPNPDEYSWASHEVPAGTENSRQLFSLDLWHVAIGREARSA
ncbi:hypothetical protein [Streptomyces sp. NPDC059071]|uniref:hypothetical protein n=1 Tax=unclassified Streptomyces TaxID=2593676 RepID=UPI0036462A4A